MKKTLIILLIAILIVGTAIIGLALFAKSSSKSVPSGTANPFASSTSNTSGATSTSNGEIHLVLSDGSTATVPDFTKTNQPEWASPTAGYQVAGSATSNFLITYILPDPSTGKAQFLITLLSEPLGDNRHAAEQALRNTLHLTDAQICSLDVSVSAGPGVSDTYSGQDLGLSFCPGATKLP